MKTIKLLVLVGSNRKGSYNVALAQHIKSLLPPEVEWNAPDLFQLPFYNEDLQISGPPPQVTDFQHLAREAQALMVISPEYNWGIPAVIKNAIDWGSRPWPLSPIGKKPVLLAGASSGPLGTGRAQLALRQVFACTKNYTLDTGDILVSFASKKFDSSGQILDEDTKNAVKKNLDLFIKGLDKL